MCVEPRTSSFDHFSAARVKQFVMSCPPVLHALRRIIQQRAGRDRDIVLCPFGIRSYFVLRQWLCVIADAFGSRVGLCKDLGRLLMGNVTVGRGGRFDELADVGKIVA